LNRFESKEGEKQSLRRRKGRGERRRDILPLSAASISSRHAIVRILGGPEKKGGKTVSGYRKLITVSLDVGN